MPNFRRVNSICVSICPKGYFLFNSRCYKLTFWTDAAPTSSSIPIQTASIVTTPAASASSSNLVSENCQNDQVWNTTTLKCQCLANNSYYDSSSKKCVQCSDGEQADQTNQ